MTVARLRAGKPEALLLAAADWVLVGEDLIGEAADLLPANLLLAEELSGTTHPLGEGSVLLMRQAWWLQRTGSLQHPYSERKFRREDVATFADAQACEADWLRRNDLAQEIAWRLTRSHELRHSRDEREKMRLRDDLRRLQPVAVSIAEPIAEIEDVALPSILEVLQGGIGIERARRAGALTAGFQATCPDDFTARHLVDERSDPPTMRSLSVLDPDGTLVLEHRYEDERELAPGYRRPMRIVTRRFDPRTGRLVRERSVTILAARIDTGAEAKQLGLALQGSDLRLMR